jgi:hypothetical protein
MWDGVPRSHGTTIMGAIKIQQESNQVEQRIVIQNYPDSYSGQSLNRLSFETVS